MPADKSFNAGAARYMVTLQRKATAARDSYGAAPRAYADVDSYWASIRQLSGREAVNAERLKVSASHLIEMRYVAEIRPETDRLKWVDLRAGVTRYFNIEIANNVDHRYRQWEIYATEVRNPPQ